MTTKQIPIHNRYQRPDDVDPATFDVFALIEETIEEALGLVRASHPDDEAAETITDHLLRRLDALHLEVLPERHLRIGENVWNCYYATEVVDRPIESLDDRYGAPATTDARLRWATARIPFVDES